ncbi:MAG: hypothetical protein BTN85_2182 [Candidatus Methanohalarchaeum thermophilum]|uniref:Uncharacterized protein n=1 Tax=Methanohalarchaeum thermophilum TaxID=1903181 RepID=A0A1Q6DT66_METT1|nr:MAG: hypothetical protein BTN85_2182 [Candidatus Methanohalarchaeum thermophilum]
MVLFDVFVDPYLYYGFFNFLVSFLIAFLVALVTMFLIKLTDERTEVKGFASILIGSLYFLTERVFWFLGNSVFDQGFAFFVVKIIGLSGLILIVIGGIYFFIIKNKGS